MKKGKEKKEENYIKEWGKGFQNSSFWAINSTKCRFTPLALNLFVKKIYNPARYRNYSIGVHVKFNVTTTT